MRLIDADALCEKMLRMRRDSATVEDIKSMRGFYGESVRCIGEWKPGKNRDVYLCSECNLAAHPRESETWNFCPRCGAKMEARTC